jgi:hypothetical protein
VVRRRGRKRGGNARTLRRYWSGHPTKHGKREHGIVWGTPGDYMRCVNRVSKYMTRKQAHGYCQLRHKQATGFYAGHAPAERLHKSKGRKR